MRSSLDRRPPCVMCNGTGKDYRHEMGEPDEIGTRPVIGVIELDRPCRACGGSGVEEDWEGVPGCTEHRTVGSHRAWCFRDACWCYPDVLCSCCLEAADYTEVWLPKAGTEDHQQMVERVRSRVEPETVTVENVIEALREERQ